VHGKTRNGKGIREVVEKRKERERHNGKAMERNWTTEPHKLEYLHAHEIKKNVQQLVVRRWNRYYWHFIPSSVA